MHAHTLNDMHLKCFWLLFLCTNLYFALKIEVQVSDISQTG